MKTKTLSRAKVRKIIQPIVDRLIDEIVELVANGSEIPRIKSRKSSKWLTTEQAAERIGVSVNTMRKWRCMQTPGRPPYKKVGRLIRYEIAELDRWLDSRSVRH